MEAGFVDFDEYHEFGLLPIQSALDDYFHSIGTQMLELKFLNDIFQDETD